MLKNKMQNVKNDEYNGIDRKDGNQKGQEVRIDHSENGGVLVYSIFLFQAFEWCNILPSPNFSVLQVLFVNVLELLGTLGASHFGC
jgi:hypothetical protein